VRIARTDPLTNALLLGGLLAGPLAWTAQLVVGYGIGDAACSPAGARWGVDSRAGEALLSVVAAAGAVGGLAVSAWLWREERRRGGDDRGRVAFMAGGGVLVNAVFLVLILLGGIAALSIAHCRQS
jgi:hypothetical protein